VSEVRETATLVYTSAVDGTGSGRRRRAPENSPRRRLATPVDGFTVDPRIMAAARAALREGERVVIVGPNDVRTVARR